MKRKNNKMPNLAKANLLARKTRSVITIFGIALAVALIMVIVGMINGTVRDYANRILNIGADIMVGSSDIGVFYSSEIVNDRYQELIRKIDGVELVTPVLIESAPSINGSKQFNYIYGIDFDNYVKLGSGFNFVAGSGLKEPNDVIIDTEIAEINKLNVGDTINFFNNDWKVVGITKKALGARFFVDRTALARIVHVDRTAVATQFFVKVKPGVNVESVAEAIRNELGEDFSVRNVKDLFESFIGGALGLREFMIAIIGVAAIICFSVILLSMYNAILERTREIGILKSLGATKRFIISEIVKEALIIVIIGIVLGILLSLGGMWLVTRVFPLLQVEFSWAWMLNSAIIAVIATMLGTLYPAWRASRLDPVEALSWE